MSIYLGVRCPACSKKFTASDDVVVCPTCGAPHHRECYSQQGKCTFENEHLSGKVWRATPETPPREEAPPIHCPRCSAANPRGSQICQVCGGHLQQTTYGGGAAPGVGQSNNPHSNYGNVGGAAHDQNQAHGYGEQPPYHWGFPGLENMIDPAVMMYGDLSPNEEIDGEAVRDLALYIGDSSAYYLAKFKAMSQGSRTITFNFAALFFNFFYYFYRKMYLPGIVLLCVFVAAIIPDFLYNIEIFPQAVVEMGFTEYFAQLGIEISGEVNEAAALHYLQLRRITYGLMFLIGTLFSLCANRLYYHKVIKGVRELRTRFGERRDERVYVEALSQAGGYNKMSALVLGISAFGGYFFINTVLIYITILGG